MDYRPSRFHLLEPDYSRPVFRLPGRARMRILKRLGSLYGSTRAALSMKEIERVMRVYHAHKTPEMIEWEKTLNKTNRFTERDAILITYGDLVRDVKQLPLETLAELSRKYLKDVFNILHILPFFPSSSDRGFAIRDFRQVDPHLGTWENINDLKDDFRLMFDGVFNHIS